MDSALVALLVGALGSAAANVAWTWNAGGVRIVAGLFATALVPVAMHLWPKVPITGWVTRALRAFVMTLVCGAAAYVNLTHAVMLQVSQGEDLYLAVALTLAMEALMVMASLARRERPLPIVHSRVHADGDGSVNTTGEGREGPEPAGREDAVPEPPPTVEETVDELRARRGGAPPRELRACREGAGREELETAPEAVGEGESPGQVYRLFAADGTLLYVGAAGDARSRIQDHQATQEWFRDVTSVTVATYASRAEADAVEAVAIDTESPRHNRVGGSAAARALVLANGGALPEPATSVGPLPVAALCLRSRPTPQPLSVPPGLATKRERIDALIFAAWADNEEPNCAEIDRVTDSRAAARGRRRDLKAAGWGPGNVPEEYRGRRRLAPVS